MPGSAHPLAAVAFLANVCTLVPGARASDLPLSDSYHICPNGFVYEAQQEQGDRRQQQLLQHELTLSVRGKLACLARCSRTDDCRGANVCPATGREAAAAGLVSCTTLTGGAGEPEAWPESACGDLAAAPDPLCVHARRKTKPEVPAVTNTPLPPACENDGTPNVDRCDCPKEYGGKTCHRPIRDCMEAYENGHRSAMPISLPIRPVNATASFLVACKLASGGSTTAIVFQRTKSSRISVDWATYQQGIGSDPQGYPFFIGLEKLHILTTQAAYLFRMWVLTSDGESGESVYVNFTVGDKSTSYTIQYRQFLKTGIPDDGFSSAHPVMFSSAGNDINNCFNETGKAGWYGTDCSGQGLLTKGTFFWPVNGQLKEISGMSFMLSRLSPPFQD